MYDHGATTSLCLHAMGWYSSRYQVPLTITLSRYNKVTSFLCAFKGGSDARQHVLSHPGSRTCFTSMYTTLQPYCSIVASCDTVAVLLRKLTVSDKQVWQVHKVERMWLSIHLPQRCSVLAVCTCSRKPLTCRASSYDFDSLDLDAPEIDNDLESYQVGVQAACPSCRHNN